MATLIALVLGTLASAALYRREFFGKEERVADADPADRPARDHHRYRAAVGVQDAWASSRDVHHRRRPRDLLRGDRLQTTSSPACAAPRTA